MIDINKFDDIEDLHISEELLGAYLEGNLHGSESREVQNFINNDASVSSLIDSVESDLGYLHDLDYSYQQGLIDTLTDEDDMFAGLVLPEITTFGMDSMEDTSSSLNTGFIFGGECGNFIDDDHSLYQENSENNNHHHDSELDFGITDNFE